MAIDPAIVPTTREERDADKIASLERRIRSLETSPVVYVGAGPPTIAARDGALYVDTAAPRLYVRAGGAWRYATLT